MTTHEEDALVTKLKAAICETREFCSEHNDIKRNRWWTNAKLTGAIISVLLMCGGSVWWVSQQAAVAVTVAADKAAMAADATTNVANTALLTYVRKEEMAASQNGQDREVSVKLEAVKANQESMRINQDKMVGRIDENTKLLNNISGQLTVISRKVSAP